MYSCIRTYCEGLQIIKKFLRNSQIPHNNLLLSNIFQNPSTSPKQTYPWGNTHATHLHIVLYPQVHVHDDKTTFKLKLSCVKLITHQRQAALN